MSCFTEYLFMEKTRRVTRGSSNDCVADEHFKRTYLPCELGEDERRFVDFVVVIFKVHTVELFS